MLKNGKILLSFGIICDGIAGNEVLYNVHLQMNNGLHNCAEFCYKYQEPFVCSKANLKDVKTIFGEDNKVYIVENEMVFSHLQKETNKALICTSDQLTTTAVSIVEYLLKANQEIYYSGDMDPEGLMIAFGLYKLDNEHVHFWHMDKGAYLKAISNESIGEQRLSLLNSIEVPSLLDTIQVIKENKKAAYQKNIIEDYLKDLK